MNWALVLAVAGFALSACSKPGNPLLSASDGQFARLIEPKNAFSPSCAAALYEPDLFVKQYNGLKFSQAGKIVAVSEQQRAECLAELQRRAVEAGMRGDITREHLADERVRQRYIAARKG
jgi:hypothetical protein